MLRKLKYVLPAAVWIVAALSLSACGGGSDSSTPTTPPAAGSTNVALASAGASISTNFAGNESFVIDGDTTTTSFWQANAVDDWLVIDFGATYAIESVNIPATGLTSNTYFTMEYSADNVTYTALNNVTSCGASMTLGASGYSCGFGTTYSARYFRYTAKAVTTPQIHEIEVMGQ